MLSLILGRSGYGKSRKILNVVENSVTINEKIIIIVPDQFSFEMERILYFSLGAKKSINIEVLGFSRLTNIIFREYGGISKKYISDGGKNLLVHMAIEEVIDELDLYKKTATNPSFIKDIAKTISELKQSSITPESLYKVSNKVFSETFFKKSEEVSLIYDAYNALLKRGYDDTDDDLTIALKLAREHDFFLGKTVFIDEFKGFTADEFNIIEEMIIKCKNIYIALCTDDYIETEDGLGLFSYVKKSTSNFLRYAKDNSVPVNNILILKEPKRYTRPELIHLEKNLFENNNNSDYFKNSDISIYTADGIYNEIEFVCAKIKNLIREKGIKYKDIAVLGRDIAIYENAVSINMNRYDIPYFYSKTESVYSKPYLMVVTSFINAATNNYNNDHIFATLKTGLMDISFEDIAELENYVYVWDIKGLMWENQFVQNPHGFKESFTNEEKEKLEVINNVREKVITPIKNFRKKTKNNITGLDFVKLLYETIENMEIPEKYTNIVKNLDKAESRSEYQQVWDLFSDSLAEYGQVLGTTYLPLKKHCSLITILIESMKIGEIPQYIDQVLVGDASLTRPNNPKYTFIIGANEGVLPKIPENVGIFTDDERKKLLDYNINISDDLQSKAIDERFIVYKALTSPSDGLFISYPLYSIKGQPLSPSSFIEELKNISGGIVIIDKVDFEKNELIQNEKSALYTLSKNYNLDNKERATLISLLGSKENYKKNLEYLKEVVLNKAYEIEDVETAKKLYGENLVISPSRVEKYMGCRFSYFAKYGLKLERREKAKLSPLEIGNLVHHALQILLQKYGNDLINIDEKTVEKDVRDILDSYIEVHMGGEEDKTARFKYLYTRLTNTLIKLINQLKREFSQSLFRPTDFELKVGKNEKIEPIELLLPTGGRIRVEGIIDRVDIMEQAGEKYVRVVDYKTGSKDFKLSDVYSGLNMQMLIYLFSIWQNGKEEYTDAIPAGVLYMPARTMPIDTSRNTSESDMKILEIKNYQMRGLVLNNMDVINGMDKEGNGIFINVPITKSGQPRKNSPVASLAELGELQSYIEKLLVKMGEELKQGKADAFPIKNGQYLTCEWCMYRNICGHEENDAFNEIERFSNNEVFNKIKKEVE